MKKVNCHNCKFFKNEFEKTGTSLLRETVSCQEPDACQSVNFIISKMCKNFDSYCKRFELKRTCSTKGEDKNELR